MFNLIKRENMIFQILQEFLNNKLDFIVVGGYAVSAYKHRFSVDADVVIKTEDLPKFEDVLLKNGFVKSISKQLENIYSSKFTRYEHKKDKISIDLLIGALASRQTGAAFSFDFIHDNSKIMTIKGTEKEIKARVPSKEMLIITKLHAGRLTDFRDIAALCSNLDFDVIRNHIFVGELKNLKDNIKEFNKVIDEPNFIGSFKGVFQEKNYKIDISEIKRLSKLID